MAISKIGAKVAHINYNLPPKGMAHCMHVAKTRSIVYDRSTVNAVENFKLKVSPYM